MTIQEKQTLAKIALDNKDTKEGQALAKIMAEEIEHYFTEAIDDAIDKLRKAINTLQNKSIPKNAKKHLHSARKELAKVDDEIDKAATIIAAE